ncbi:MAG TPA: TonB-dependent receptor [Gemmatimonadaceae bacterium]
MTARAMTAAALALLLAAPAASQQPTPAARTAVIEGVVRAGERPVPFAQLAVEGTTHGAVADSGGRFRLAALPAGRQLLLVRAIGHRPLRRAVQLAPGEHRIVDLELEAVGTSLGPMVTTATLKETYVAESPVKVDVVTARVLERNASHNLMENLSFVNGLTQQVDCGVCFTNNIRINGMDGPYTAMLIDGAPVMSALATVYGLNGIHPSIIQQVEVSKGPSSTLFGSEAMGGVINVITKDPRFAPRASLDAYATSNGETSLDFALAPDAGGARTLLSGSLAYTGRVVDENGDGFGDLPLMRRAALFGKWAGGTAARRTLELSVRYWYEDRANGVAGFTRADRGSDVRYGEAILTHHASLVGAYRFPGERRPLKLDVALDWHDQDSWYGTQPFAATQGVGFAQLLWNVPLGRHDVLLGTTLRLHGYEDSSAVHATRERRVVPGVFAQDELTLSRRWTLLAGLRADHHEAHGTIASPRIALRWEADEHTTLRLNAATGFRVVNLFTEDHAALTGAREVVLDEALDPERSVSVTASLQHLVHVLGTPDALVVDLDVFHTRFSNRIVADYDRDPDLVVYANLDGHALTRGLSASVQYADPLRPLSGSIGVTLQDARIVEPHATRRLPFAPSTQLVLALALESDERGLTLDWTARALGPMALPRSEGLPSRSPWFSEHHLQLTKSLGEALRIYAGVKNLFGWVQRDAIVAPDDPFGDRFDTTRVYGPLQGRRLIAGARWSAGR